MTLTNERLREMAESANGGPYLRDMATEILALRADAARLAWLQNYCVEVFFSSDGCTVIGRDESDAIVMGFGETLSAAVDSAIRKTK
jgi:hypothetical protein